MIFNSIESIVMYRKYNNYIVTLLLAFLLLGMLVAPASAFSFRGYTYNETNVTLNNTNVSIEVYLIGRSYLFSWEEIPGNDSERLIDFLKSNYDVDWVETATIDKTDNGKKIKITAGKKSISLNLNNENTELNLKIDNGKTDKFIVKTENGKLNIYGGQYGTTLNETFYNLSDETGSFNVSVTLDGDQYLYKPVLKHYINNETSGTLDWVGQSLPMMPYPLISSLTAVSPMNFYLREGATININTTNGTGENQYLRYMINDQTLGYPVAENYVDYQENITVHVPRDRNYSIIVFTNKPMPLYYNLNNISDYESTNYVVNLTFNTDISLKWVSGYAKFEGTAGFENLTIIAFPMMEPGNMIAKKHSMPDNMSAWQLGMPNTFNTTTGFYNFTLPGHGQGVNYMLFANAKNNSDTYYGAFRKITLNFTQDNVSNFNFSLVPLLGKVKSFGIKNTTGDDINVETKQLPFQLKNKTDQTNITKFAHVDVKVNYSDACDNCSAFRWLVSVNQNQTDPTNDGGFNIIALNANISKINVFMQDFAPKKTSKNVTQLANWPVNIGMKSFNNTKPNGDPLSGIKIDMLISKPECDRPNPEQGCSLFRGQEMDQGIFDPFKIVMGGGKISLRIKQTTENITVHYKNVDMLASGPPDALFDDSPTQSQSGTALEQAWKFGSNGPKIYDEVLIGIPIDSRLNASNITVKLGKLFDEDWNEQWNISANNIGDIPSDYSEFNETWFNSTTGMPCNSTDDSSKCYVDVPNRTVWLRIPHFSGFASTISSESVGGVNVTLSPDSGISESTVNMNFTVKDDLNATSWFNFTFPSRFSIVGAIIDYFIDGNRTGWTVLGNSTGSDYIKVSSGNTFAYAGNTAYINISNITINGGGTETFTINVTTNNTVTVPVTYNVTAAVVRAVSFTNVTPLTDSVVIGTNATYYLNLTNTGTDADSYNLTIVNPNNAETGINISTTYYPLASNESKIFALNVTNASSGTFKVNITATSTNDYSKSASVNTTTIVPIVVKIINPANTSINTTGDVNVTVTLDNTGLAQYLNWDGVNYSMTPNRCALAGTVFFYNKSGLLSSNYSFKVYANDTTGVYNVSETRILTVNRTTLADLSLDENGAVNKTNNITAPSRNVTLTIFNGTNATLNGTTINNITIDSLKNVNATFVANIGSDKLIGENLSLGPEGARFSPDLQIRFNYTGVQLTAAGISASQLRVKFYNTTLNRWIEQPYTLHENGSNGYLIVNVSHFSVFALIGIPTTTTATTTSSSGGGGGSGYKSGENASNIEVVEKYDIQISKDVLTSYRFTHAKNPIMFVNITGNTSIGVITASIEILKNTSTLVNFSAEGLVYKNTNIWVGTSGYATPKNSKEALIKFRVSNEWMSTNGVSANDIMLVKWDGTSWINLETKVLSKDNTNTYFEGKTNSFSPFAIVAKTAAVAKPAVTTTAPSGTPKITETATPEPTKKTPGFGIVLALLGLMAVVLRKRS
jgi:PGF-pre-PGF domain-containing protein